MILCFEYQSTTAIAATAVCDEGAAADYKLP